LTIYLFTFVVAFARAKRRLSRAPTVAAVMLAFAALLDTRFTADVPAGFRLAVHLSLLLAVGLAAHGRLAADRPHPARLTEFYLLLSLGGALGGLLNGLVAPIVLDRPMEYPLVLATVPLLLLGLGRPALGALARRYGTLGRAVVPLLGAAVVSVTVLTLDRSGQDRLASAAALTGIPLVAG